MTLLAALCAAGAVWLWLFRARPGATDRPGRLTLGALVLPGALLAAWALVVLLGTRGLVLGILASAAAAVAGRLIAGDRGRRRAADLRRDVVEICETLAGELRSGIPPAAALRHVAGEWPVLDEVATAAELGGDIPPALRRLAARPGAESLGAVAAAWQVSQVTGAGLAAALERCSDSARADHATAELVAAELASARATARLLAVLPVVVLTMGRATGSDPWSFLLASWPGIACLAAGLVLSWLGLAWVERIGERSAR